MLTERAQNLGERLAEAARVGRAAARSLSCAEGAPRAGAWGEGQGSGAPRPQHPVQQPLQPQPWLRVVFTRSLQGDIQTLGMTCNPQSRAVFLISHFWLPTAPCQHAVLLHLGSKAPSPALGHLLPLRAVQRSPNPSASCFSATAGPLRTSGSLVGHGV